MMAAADIGWTAVAPGWQRHASAVEQWLDDASARLLSTLHLSPGARVLEVAAGAGGLTRALARAVGPTGDVLATDISAAMLAQAEGMLQACDLAQVRTQLADAQSLDMAGAGFDAVACRLGLMFCCDPRAALRSMHAALRPGGRLGVLVFGEARANPCITALLETAWSHAHRPLESHDLPGQLPSLGSCGLLASLCREAGFAEVCAQELDAPFELPSVDHYLEFVRAAGSPVLQVLAPLSPAMQQAAWDEMGLRLADHATPAGWRGPHRLLLCSGLKTAVDETPSASAPHRATGGLHAANG
ncbi:MAG: methyltransferase domain-containing protein [Variovorax sp.]|nr:MAG: methyltransferase domain-containing protein [Variovorax sp.]